MPAKKSKRRRSAHAAPHPTGISASQSVAAAEIPSPPIPRTRAFARTRSLGQSAPWASKLFGFDGLAWAALIVVIPIMIICLELTVGPMHNEWPLVDSDFWWHLATGNWILDRHSIPLTDSYSWTHNGEEWIAHEWLAEVFLALSWRAGGYAGGIILTAIVSILGFWRLIEGCRYYGLNRLAALVTVLVLGGVYTRAGVMTVRPQVWTWAMMAVLFSELAAYDTGRRKQLWVVPVIIALMINMNLTALIALGCIGAFVIDRIIRPPVDRHVVLIGILSGLAVLINPNHIKLPLLTLQYIGEDAIWRQYILEWMPPKFSDRSHVPFWIGLVLLIPAVWALARKRPYFWPAAPLIVVAYQSYKSLRYIPVYILIAIIFVGWLAGQWQKYVQARSEAVEVEPAPAPKSALIPLRPWALVPLVGALGLSLYLSTNTELTQFRRDPNVWTHPARATNFYLNNYPNTKLFNTYDFGGYLIYRFANTDNKVFVDGRAEMYGDEFIRKYFDLIYGREGWQEYFNENAIQVVMIRRIDGLSTALSRQPGWTLVYEDQLHLVFVRAFIAHPPIQ